jgi:hypothetical protein
MTPLPPCTCGSPVTSCCGFVPHAATKGMVLFEGSGAPVAYQGLLPGRNNNSPYLYGRPLPLQLSIIRSQPLAPVFPLSSRCRHRRTLWRYFATLVTRAPDTHAGIFFYHHVERTMLLMIIQAPVSRQVLLHRLTDGQGSGLQRV